MIGWAAFDWQSFSTLATVGAVVFAETRMGCRWVGITKRQAGIAEAQSAIHARKTEIEAQQLKAELFDRRTASFKAAAGFIIRVRDNRPDRNAEGRARFFLKYRESQSLFSSTVYRDLTGILDKAQELWMTEEGILNGREKSVPRNSNSSKKAPEAASWLLRRIETLTEIFAGYLRFEYPEIGQDIAVG